MKKLLLLALVGGLSGCSTIQALDARLAGKIGGENEIAEGTCKYEIRSWPSGQVARGLGAPAEVNRAIARAKETDVRLKIVTTCLVDGRRYETKQTVETAKAGR